MKKILFASLSLIILVSMMLTSAFSALAAEEIKVNNVTAKPGDIITYSVKINGLSTTVSAINASVKYKDSDFALISGDDENSAIVIGSALQSVIYNETYKDEFLFNAANGVTGFDFSEDNSVITLSFKVLDTAAEKADISFEFTEIYNMGPEPLSIDDDYTVETITEVNVYNGETQTVDKSKPSINQDTNSTINPTSIDPNAAIEVNSEGANSSAGSSLMKTILFVVIALVIVAMVLILLFVKKPEDKTNS